jgi:hypothetical protein
VAHREDKLSVVTAELRGALDEPDGVVIDQSGV